MLYYADSEHVLVSSMSLPATRVLVEETVVTKKVEMREGVPLEGNPHLL